LFLLTLSFLNSVSRKVKSPKDTSATSANAKESEFVSDKVKEATSDRDLKEIQQNMTKLGMTVAPPAEAQAPPPAQKKTSGGKAVT
jgi:hypothetical protein